MFKCYQFLNGSLFKNLKCTDDLKSTTGIFFKKAGTAMICAIFTLSVTACGGGDHKAVSVKKTDMHKRITGYVGSVSADEPQAAMMAREILIRGGNAADAAAALGFALTVTLPSRASLGGGGACLAYRPGEQAKAFLFLPPAGKQKISRASDRPAAIPMMARGLYLLQADYGQSDINDILSLVGNLAQNGVPVSDMLANDLAAVQGPLLSNPSVQKIFVKQDGSLLKAGDSFYQPRLKIIYDRFISSGISDLYIGSLARSYILGAQSAGGQLLGSDFRNALPVQAPALENIQGNSITYFLPPPADGGFGMAMVWRTNGRDISVAQGSVARWRSVNPLVYTKDAVLKESQKAQMWLDAGKGGKGNLPSLPASTSFSVVDRNGEAVSCALTMNNLFGTGRVAGTTGIIMAASPKTLPQPLLTAAISTYKRHFVAAVAASGQNEAAGAAYEALSSLLDEKEKKIDHVVMSHPATPQGRVNAVYCKNSLPGDTDQCRAYTDSKGMGLAITR